MRFRVHDRHPEKGEKKVNRKELKKAGRKSFFKHYPMLVFLCLIIALFGTEGSQSVDLIKRQTSSITQAGSHTILQAEDVFTSIIEGDLSLSEEISQMIRDNIPDEIENSAALGTTNGVLSGVFSSYLSGTIYTTLAEAIFGMTKSQTATQVLFILFCALVMFALWFFIRNVMTPILRRMFLESRTYAKLPFLHTLHFAAVRKWFHACFTMFLVTLFQTLWWLTIVGGIIKHYSYYLVPYIVAENPGMKATEAITLSRKMMNGHKWEAFVLDLSMIGWVILGFITLGLSDLFFGFPYRISVRTEYYVRLRQMAKEQQIANADQLDDVYLYEQCDKITLYEAYFDVVDQQTYVLENEKKRTGVRAFFLKWFSIWLWSFDEKIKYDEVEGIKYAAERNVGARDGKSYPLRLNPRWKERKFKIKAPFSFLRAYSVWTLILLFILFCFIGWAWEVFFYIMQDGAFYNRGMLHGPWLPVYGSGGLIALLICSRFRKNPVVELIVCVVLCGTIEYLAAYMLETNYGERWWSYDGYFLNIHGRVCAEGLIVFGIACMLVVYLIAPFFDFIVSKIPVKILRVIALGLFIVFQIDVVYSVGHPNKAEGAVESNRLTSEVVEDAGSTYELPPEMQRMMNM